MSNLTITVDGHVLARARARALALGTSVNAILRKHLEAFAGADIERERALQELVALAQRGPGRSRGPGWTRDDLHER